MTTYSASIKSDDWGEVVVTGRTDGASAPTYEWGDPGTGIAEALLGSYLEDGYRQGLYSTGSVGEVRDMLYAMSEACRRYTPGGMTMEVPDDTAAKAEAEAEKFWAELPPGAVP